MHQLVARLWQFVLMTANSNSARLAVGTTAITVGINELRQEAVRLAPTSDPEALEEAARQVLRMLGKDGSDIRGPKSIGDWNYFHMNMRTGDAWFTRKYISSAGQKALIRAITRAPSRIVGGGVRAAPGSFRRYGGGRGFST